MLKGFKDFIMKGNVVDLAVGVVIGAAFGNVVTAMVTGIITPIIGAIGGTPDFSTISFTVNNSKFMVGAFINSLISFVTIAGVIYFVIVVPKNKIMDKMKRGKSNDPTEKTCPFCQSFIPIKAKKCKFCTSSVR